MALLDLQLLSHTKVGNDDNNTLESTVFVTPKIEENLVCRMYIFFSVFKITFINNYLIANNASLLVCF